MLRKFLTTTFLSFLFIVIIIFNGWNIFKINAGIKNILISKLKSTFGEDCSVDNVSVGLGSVNLAGVKLAFHNSPYEVWIKELRLGYSLQSLLKGKGELDKTAEEITLFKPRFTLTYNPDKNLTSDVDLSLQISSETEKLYRAIIKESDTIKKITISEGEIVILNSNSSVHTRVAKRINGWAFTDNKGLVRLRLAGHIFESEEYNMVLYGQLDLNRGGIDFVNVDLHDYKIGNEIPFLIPDYFDVLNGLVNGHLIVTERFQPTRGFNIDGTISLKNGLLKLKSENLFVDDINAEAEVKNWNLEIKKASLTVNDSPTNLEGKINNLLEPEFDLRLTSKELNVENFLTQFLPDKSLPFRGTSNIDILISDSPKTPNIRGQLKSDSLFFLNRKVNDFVVDLNFVNLALNFENISGKIDNAEISGKGGIDFASTDKLLDFKFNIQGEFSQKLQNWGFKSTDHCIGQSEIIVLGSLNNPVSRGEYSLFFTKEKSESLTLNGSFIYSQKQLTLNAVSNDDEFHLTASANNILKNPKLNLQATKFEKLFGFFNNPKLEFLKNHYNLNLFADNNDEKLYFVIDGYRQDNYEKIFQIAADTISTNYANKIMGTISLFPNSSQKTEGEFEFDFNADEVQLTRLSLGNWLDGTLIMSKNNYTPQNGKLSISGLKLSFLLSLLGKEASNFEGDLYGQINIEHSGNRPNYSGNLWLLNGFFRGVGPLKGEMNFISDSSVFQIKKLDLEKTESTHVLAEGQYNFSTKEVDGTIAGTEVDVNEVLKIITDKEGYVKGTSIVQVTVHGQLPKVSVYGNVKFHNAKILMFEFDEGTWNFGNMSNPNGSYITGDELYIGNLVFKRFGEFSLEGTGHLPFKNKQSLDVRVSGDGNFLVFLSDMEDFFIDSKSSGHLDLHLSGQYKEPDFTGSKFTCDNGTLNLSSVIKSVKNLEMELEVMPEDYFLDIIKLRGKIQDEPVSISNTNILSGLNHGLYEPLRIAGDDLNLGALIFKTPDKGVQLNIPGLMEKGEIGWFSLNGRTSGEQFFVTGPWSRPVVRGEVRLRNTNLMFPFDEGTGEGNEIVMNILDNINWDVRAVSEKDTRYVRQFTTGVYVNMDIDKDNSELFFTGILKDSTFQIGGKVESTRGEFEYVDLNFRVDRFGAEFNQTSLYPMVYGKAWTVVRDSSNTPSDVYLTLYTVDDLTQEEVKKGRWDRLNIKLSSEFPGYDETQGQIMAALGYTSETVEEKATKAVGYRTDKLIFRPLIRPIERQLERKLGLDVVRFSYAITRNFLDANFTNEELNSTLALLRSSRLTLGKYLTDDIYFLYTGELKAGIDYQFLDKGFGLQHIFGLEYRLNSSWLLQMEYDYNTLLEKSKDDKKIWLRHSFPF